MYSVQLGIPVSKTDPEAKSYLISLMDRLEAVSCGVCLLPAVY